MRLRVHLLPQLTNAEELADQVVVVIDVLRATTTILAALDNGAVAVIPCRETDEAVSLARSRNPRPLLGGERHGLLVPGFNLGNSPAEYKSTIVHGREIVMTTTNGTRALDACKSARQVLLASFTNCAAVLDRLATESEVHIVCAGTDRSVTAEDSWLAGSLIDGLVPRCDAMELNDAGRLCHGAWRMEFSSPPDDDRLYECLVASQGGRNLAALGLTNDVRFAASIDRSSSVACLHVQRNRIELV